MKILNGSRRAGRGHQYDEDASLAQDGDAREACRAPRIMTPGNWNRNLLFIIYYLLFIIYYCSFDFQK